MLFLTMDVCLVAHVVSHSAARSAGKFRCQLSGPKYIELLLLAIVCLFIHTGQANRMQILHHYCYSKSSMAVCGGLTISVVSAYREPVSFNYHLQCLKRAKLGHRTQVG